MPRGPSLLQHLGGQYEPQQSRGFLGRLRATPIVYYLYFQHKTTIRHIRLLGVRQSFFYNDLT